PEAGTYYFRLVARSKSAQFSEPSDRVEQELAITSIDLEITDAWLTGEAPQNTADGKNSIWRGPDEPEVDPDRPFKDGDIWFEMVDGKSVPNIWDEAAGAWVANDDYRQSEIERVQDELRQELDDIVIDGSGTKNFYQSDEPTEGTREGDLWFDVSDQNKPYIYQDGEWVSVRDSYIEDGSVTTDKIAAGAITAESGIIGSIDAGTITVGEMDGARIKAQSIAADRVLVGQGGELCPDPWFDSGPDSPIWNSPSAGAGSGILPDGAMPGHKYGMVLKPKTAQKNMSLYAGNITPGHTIPVEPNETYVAYAWVYSEAEITNLTDNSGNYAGVNLQIYGYENTDTGSEGPDGRRFAGRRKGTFPAGEWIKVGGEQFTVGPNTRAISPRLTLYFPNNSDPTTGDVYIGQVSVRKAAGATLIEDG